MTDLFRVSVPRSQCVDYNLGDPPCFKSKFFLPLYERSMPTCSLDFLAVRCVSGPQAIPFAGANAHRVRLCFEGREYPLSKGGQYLRFT
jgi:hypothetical protein